MLLVERVDRADDGIRAGSVVRPAAGIKGVEQRPERNLRRGGASPHKRLVAVAEIGATSRATRARHRDKGRDLRLCWFGPENLVSPDVARRDDDLDPVAVSIPDPRRRRGVG